ncbi:MAG: DUF885 domain-containing protein [Acidobacteria bacterium]|nr:DUF885 domain-containing protein [Acidobacteriota bacterium]
MTSSRARVLVILFVLAPLAQTEVTMAAEPKAAAASPFRALEERYFIEFLKRNPVTATYIGGDAYRADLAELGASLRDFSTVGLRDEDAVYTQIDGALSQLARGSLTPDEAIDAAVMESQIRFMHALSQERRHQLRCIDTYMVEPFRGVDWQLQGMTPAGDGAYGTRDEWERVVRRVQRIPDYLATARANLKAGVAAGNVPDWRMIEKDGVAGAEANAAYFEKTLADLFGQRTRGQAFAASMLPSLRKAGLAAAEGYREFRRFLLDIYYTKEGAKALGGAAEIPGTGVFRTHDLLKPEFRKDHFAFGEAAYARAVKDNLRVAKPIAALYDEADGRVRATRDELIAVAKSVATAKGWPLTWGDAASDAASTRAVMSKLGDDAPKDDAEMIAWYRAKSFDLVEYGRKHRLFDIPADYKLDVFETPEVLLATIDGAAYYPAPPFKKSGVGRFYVSPTGNDAAHLRENNRSSLADLCAHEGFPGHDWDAQFLRTRMGAIGNVRWLTPGAVEDSSSMWFDSMRTEGWALYGEALMAEPQEGAPEGVYSPEERIYQLQGLLLRDARVRVDIGIHTGRMTFDEAVDYYTTNVDFFAGACGKGDPESRASCETATRAMFRYSKWPTQAITYRIGKQEIVDLREEVRRIQGDRWNLRAFHEKVLGAGAIPLAFARQSILEWARSGT